MTDQPNETPGVDGSTVRASVRRRAGRFRTLGLFVAGVAATFLALALYSALFPGPAPLTSRDVNDSIAHALASQTPAPALSQGA